MKSLVLVLCMFLAGCAATESVTQIKLSNGSVLDVVRTRSDVAVGDCGTQLVQYLFTADGKMIDAKSERGHALHCDMSVAIINAGATVGAANQIRRGLAAGADSTSITNSNSQDQDQVQAQAQSQMQSQAQSSKNLVHVKPGVIQEKHGKGNNGKGNGGGDGTPNGKEDEGR